MKILFAGKKERGVRCLTALCDARHEIVGVIAQAGDKGAASVAVKGVELGLALYQFEDVNAPTSIEAFRALKPDLIVFAGFGQIVGEEFIRMAPRGALNLHAGKLPHYRGSSPLNWVLINGERDFSLSIIQVDRGVDTGDIVVERTFPIGENDTIADLQRIADATFPGMLVGAVAEIGSGAVRARAQRETGAAYYPLRFPEDGLVLWDMRTAVEIHNSIRALTDPYPGAFTFFKGKKIMLLGSRLSDRRYHGEPGRVYMKKNGCLLVCAKDECLWITQALAYEGAEDAFSIVERYDTFSTVAEAMRRIMYSS